MRIITRNSFPEVHKATPFKLFSIPYVDNYSNIIIKLVINIFLSNIYNNIFNGLGHNRHTHIHLSGILDLRELYHKNNILFYGSKNILFSLQSIRYHYNIQVTKCLAHFLENQDPSSLQQPIYSVW